MMGHTMDKQINVNPEVVLREWRTKILNGFLTIVAVAAAVGTVVSILDAISRPGQWPVVILFSILEVILIVLAVFRKIDYRIRAWGVLLVPYIVCPIWHLLVSAAAAVCFSWRCQSVD
jgi:uncharacterized protein (DUF983 family)